ncbi:MAG: response regulator transcription factor [Chloroflexi bacterium]|nr:response regulator transcription factor [Chloroflexota bacterium]OJV94177.1 MAG: DNA-binding response regulator [Chloroflexi bacterium 54-19]
MNVKVLIADDHNVVRQGMQTFLSLDPEIEVVGTAINGVEAVAKTLELKPDLVILDLLMPEMNGIEATAQIKALLPHTKVLIFTSVLESDAILRALKAGANGYLLKSIQSDELCRTIKMTTNGPVLLSSDVVRLLIKKNEGSSSAESLTERETEVLRLLAEGKANKEIAHRLQLSEGTIKTHVSIILAKLGLQSRTQAALYAANAGLLTTSQN